MILTEGMLKEAHKQLTSTEGMSPKAKEVVRRFNEDLREKARALGMKQGVAGEGHWLAQYQSVVVRRVKGLFSWLKR